MLSHFLYQLFPYQIFKSVSFRAGMGYITAYLFMSLLMPQVIKLFRKKGITSDFKSNTNTSGPYSGATPIMGGVVIIPSIIISTFLWGWINHYTISLILILLSFGTVGLIDDGAKVFHRLRVEAGEEAKKGYANKADGISAKLRLFLEFATTSIVLGIVYYFFEGMDGKLHIPMIPMKTWFPQLPEYLVLPFAIMIVVGGANAVNLTDGLDTLATIPIMTCALFVACAAYISGDIDLSTKLKTLFVDADLKEVAVFALILIGACFAFLKFNCPPAAIYMGDVGSLGLGAAICTMFIFVKAELYLPIVGGTFVLAAMSSIIQRIWFKIALIKNGRKWAEKNRFFYRAPYHHHIQSIYRYGEKNITSAFHKFSTKLGFHRVAPVNQFKEPHEINSKVIWNSHIKAIWLLVITLLVFFKVR